MKKYKKTTNGFVEIDDYGILDYLYKSESYTMYKLIISIYEDEYVISYDKARNTSHYSLYTEINREFGLNSIICIGGYGTQLDMFNFSELNNSVIEALIGVLLEIKEFYLKTNEDIFISLTKILNPNSDMYNGNDIDNIIESLEKLMNVKSKI